LKSSSELYRQVVGDIHGQSHNHVTYSIHRPGANPKT